MCRSRFGRFCVNTLHFDEPLNIHIRKFRLNYLLDQVNMNESDDYIKINNLMKQYENNSNSIEESLHLYTLETRFYKTLKQDCLPLAIPLFIHLSNLKDRYFKGRVYRGMHMTYEQLLIYQIAMDTPGTVLQTRAFSSTSMDHHVAEEFADVKAKKNEKDLCVLFIFHFPDECDKAINLSRISSDTPCLSEYEDEKEVFILS
jgi:mRNA-degrading endonuclease YafQ of YafQ-DinJ toxin-antitoxin module